MLPVMRQILQTPRKYDFVSMIRDMDRSYSRMRLYRVSATNYYIVLDDGSKYIAYSFIKDANDDFYRLDNCFSGSITDTWVGNYSITDAGARTGTWDTSSVNYYTTEVGATFTCNPVGSKLLFRHFADNRGGVWKFAIDGDTENPILISTWGTSNAVETTTLITGLTDGVAHTVVATFMGDDPLHSPTGGVSRGWVVSTEAIKAYNANLGASAGDIMSPGSNKEVAIQLVKSEAIWVPEHTVGSAFNVVDPVLSLDDVAFDITTLSNGQFSPPCSKFSLTQNVYGRHTTDGNLVEILISHIIETDAVCKIAGTMEILQDVTVGSFYPLMMPATSTVLNEFVTGITNSKISAGDETYHYFGKEKDKVYSGCAIDGTRKNFICAMTVNNPDISLRKRQAGRPVTERTLFIWQRATYPKMYFNTIYNFAMTTGETFSWEGRFIIAEITNIYDHIKSL